MKQTFISFLFLFYCLHIAAKSNYGIDVFIYKNKTYEFFLGTIIDYSKANYFDKSVQKEKNIPKSHGDNAKLIIDSGPEDIYLEKDQILIIRAINILSQDSVHLVELKETGIKSVTLSIGNCDPHEYLLADGDKQIHDYYIKLNDYYELNKNHINNNDIVKIEVKVFAQGENDASMRLCDKDIKFKIDNYPIIPYEGFNSNTSGFWFPALLFSSNLKSNENGIPFASMPIGIAWGGYRKFGNKNHYIGGSIMANWLIYSEGKQNPDLTTANNFNFTSVTIGAMIDINNLFYIGYAYGLDFRSNYTNAKNMIVFGFAPGIINFLKSKK